MPREKLSDERRSITHKVDIEGQYGEVTIFITAGYYESGDIGELFLNVGKHGSTLQGALDSWAILVSLSLQSGMSLDSIVSKFSGIAFEPSGKTTNPAIPQCSSLIDYTVKWIDKHRRLE